VAARAATSYAGTGWSAGTVALVEAPAWLVEIGLSADGPPWLSMGLSRCGPEGWLWPDDLRDAELAEKDRLLAERHDEVFAARPGTDAAGAETLDLVQGWLAEHRPELPGPAVPDGVHPLEAAARLVQEDLCLMVERDGASHLDAACLCFPSHWRLSDKLGRPAAEVHGPVPRYDTELSDRVDRYLTRLRPDVIGVRRNWTVHDSPALFAPERPAPGALTAEEVADRLWLRSERQTLRRLPRSDAVLFTIRVQQAPFGVLAERPAVAAALAARMRAQPTELTDMNGLAAYEEAVLAWLDGAAG
jgi:hypothetical protein